VRPLLVAAVVAAVIAGPLPARAYATAPKPGDSITQSELLSYLFAAPQPGDWVRYSVSVDGSTILTKTIGFGAERFDNNDTAFFEIQTQSSGLIDAPVSSQTIAGGNIVWKMFIDAPNFNDVNHLYAFVAGVIKIGDALFRLGSDPSHPVSPAYHQTLQSLLLYGSLALPDQRRGVVATSEPEDVTIGRITVHAVHTSVDFSAAEIGMAAGLPASRIETWQSPDVPLGIVSARSLTNGRTYSVDLTAFGRRSYRTVINQQFESIPYFPGG
jgi:hypothetical protein